MFRAWFHHFDILHKNSITIFYAFISSSIQLKDTFPFFFSQSNKTFPVMLESSRNITRFPSLGLSCTIHRKSRATLPSPILGCIANDSSSTRKIIFDWAARALELGRKQAPLPLSPLRGRLIWRTFPPRFLHVAAHSVRINITPAPFFITFFTGFHPLTVLASVPPRAWIQEERTAVC